MMKTFIIVGILLLATLIVGGCTQQQGSPQDTYIDVTPAEAKALINENPDLIVIDVSPAYADGHLPGAVSYYLGDGSLDAAIPMLDQNATYLVYCHVESVAIQGAQKLVDAGFMNVYRLEGNYAAWVDAGYPIEYVYVDITAAEAKALIDENPDLIVIDVSPAYADGHLPGAVSYYLGDGSLDAAIPMLDQNATYLVYCHVESVAIQGAQKLVDAGFMNVYRLEGNYAAWVDAGYPIET